MALFSQSDIPTLEQGYQAHRQQQMAQAPAVSQTQHQGPGGIKGFLVNNLPAITSGVGAVAGSFLAPGAGTVGGGAAGGAVGEALKRKLLGQSLDAKEIAIQGIEGGALSGIGGAGRAVTTAARGLTKVGARSAEKQIAGTVEKKAGSSFMNNLTTQGQQAQGRVTGISAGSKVGAKELTPQDTEQMLQTLKDEGIQTGNANNTLRDITTKLKGYGQQIADHFKTNDHPLKPEDTKVIADNFTNSLKTTDPSIVKQAEILTNDLQKNVKSTKDLWDFRKTLDSRIPDSKFMDATTTSKVAALKAMREYVSKELGSVPAMGNYHSLSEIKPFVSSEAKRLNNPGGGIVGRLLSSGPVQKTENQLGKVAEKIGSSAKAAPAAAETTAPTANLAQKLIGAAASPIANPGTTALQVGKQELGRGFGIPAAISQQTPDQSQPSADASTGLLDNGADTAGEAQPQDTSPFAPANIQENIKKIMAQGGTMKDVSEYLTNAKAFNDLTGSTGGAKKPISATAADAIANAQAGLQSLDTIEQELANNPGVQQKSAASQIANPFGITSRLAGTGKYDSALSQAKDVIARLRTGAAISSSEEKRFTAMLPQPADSQDVVTQKLGLLKNALNTIVQRVGGNGSDLIQEAAQASQ